MRLKTINMKFINSKKILFGTMALAFSSILFAQQSPKEKRIDGVVAVVGEHVILDSDIDKMYLEIKSRSMDITEVSRCEILGMLMEDKFYAHHAVQDSVIVTEERIKEVIDNNIEFLLR